jgi:energy-coupling factor transporter ATP-binding protein EcfA2
MTPVFGIAGRSGSGKTTLIEAMLPLLGARGLKVSVIKHSHHDFEMEPPGKDSARFRQAGAQEVMVASPFRYAIVRELRGAPEPSLAEQWRASSRSPFPASRSTVWRWASRRCMPRTPVSWRSSAMPCWTRTYPACR